MLRTTETNVAFNLLINSGINAETASAALENKPQLNEILHIIQNEKLFTDNKKKNTELCLALISNTNHLPEFGKTRIETVGGPAPSDTGEDKYSFFHGHNIDNLVLVYRLLGGKD